VLKLERQPKKKTDYDKLINDLDRSTRKHMQDLYDRTLDNKLIPRYYEKYAREIQDPTLFNKADNVRNCFKYIVNDTYEDQRVKAIKKTVLCHDYKYCANCQKIIQEARIMKYMPLIRKHAKDCYHLTITQPSCSAENLKKDIEKMSACFKHLTEILRCRTKVRDVDFNQYGYKGCIRSLETTYKSNPKDIECYHAHFHCCMNFHLNDKTVLEYKQHRNKYSYDKNKPDEITLFSDLEILIQRVWYLLWNDMEITKKNIESIKTGYSCKMTRFKNKDAREIFKYMTKVTDEKNKLMKYDHFKTLYNAMYRKKQLQAYGCFNQKDITENDIKTAADNLYQELIASLDEKESPTQQVDRTKDLLKSSQYRVISHRKILKSYIDVDVLE
jgi:hypothetical protein